MCFYCLLVKNELSFLFAFQKEITNDIIQFYCKNDATNLATIIQKAKICVLKAKLNSLKETVSQVI